MRRTLAFTFMFALSACATDLPVIGAGSCAYPGAKTMLVAELAFGRNVKGGPGVSDNDWAQFQRETLSRQFPDGMTVQDAEGEWADPRAKQLVREPTKWVKLALPDTPASLQAIRTATETYKRRFGQDSVLVITNQRCVAF